MYAGNFELGGRAGPGLNASVAVVDGLLAHLARPETAEEEAAIVELRASWVRLVELLAARSEPDVQLCPVCSRIVTGAATLCSFCWSKRGPVRRSLSSATS